VSRILVTGGSGFIGSNLVEHCHGAGHEVLNLDIRRPRNPAAHGRFVQANILHRDVLLDTVREFDPHYIFHLAARTDLDGASDSDYDANITGVSNMVAAAKAAPSLKRAIFASSMYVCKLGYIPSRDDEYCPHTVYGRSKELGEGIVRREAGDSFSWAVVRPTSIWGPWFDIPYKTFFDTVRKGLYVHPKGHDIRRSYGFVLNTVRQLSGLIEFAEADEVQGKVFYLADYAPIDPLQWARIIADRFGAPKVRQVPLGAMRACASLGDILKSVGFAKSPIYSFRLNNLLTNAIFDLGPIQRISGDSPYTLEQGVEITVEWMRQQATRP
jgi:nucleoside-diphosphate-sugar epimerase